MVRIGASRRVGGRWRALAAAVLVASTTLAFLPTGTASAASDVRLNQMQVLAAHNAYHVELPWETIQAYAAVVPDAITLAYSHPPLAEQFDHRGIRQVELDVYADPAGDLYRPLGTAGFKVLHIKGLDEGATCEVFVECLRQVKAWSDANPSHMPIGVQVELKDANEFPLGPVPIFIGPAELDALDAEFRSVFPPERLITPDDVRGGHATLEEAVLTDGWPRIDDVRGRVLLVLDNKRDEYVQGHPSLAGRVGFAPSQPGQPDAAFIKENDPTGANEAYIQGLVAQGYLVRTRADEPVTTPLSGDTSQRDAALRSGAQWVSTDYPVPGLTTRWNSDYVAQIPGGTPARCNPVNAPPGCQNADIEDLPDPTEPTGPTSTSTPSTSTPTSVVRRAAPGVAAPVAVTPRFTG